MTLRDQLGDTGLGQLHDHARALEVDQAEELARHASAPPSHDGALLDSGIFELKLLDQFPEHALVCLCHPSIFHEVGDQHQRDTTCQAPAATADTRCNGSSLLMVDVATFRLVPALSSLLAFGIASIALLVIPGPAVTYIVNRSVADGRAVALASVAGLELGNFVHVVAATVGLSAVLATSATAFTVVKWVGAGYLIGVGVNTLLTRPERLSGRTTHTTYRRAFTQGVVVNTLNPKVALFFLSFLPQFIEPDRGPAWVQALVLGSLFTGLGLMTDGTWALVASAVRGMLFRGRAMPFVRRYVSGSTFVALGLVAARAQRSTV